MTTADRIEKTTILRAPIERVWSAIADSRKFGIWFGVEFDGPFVAGSTVKGRIVPTKVDPEIAKTQDGYTGMPCDFHVERIDPMRHFSFRWIPYEVEPGAALADEATTLITFELEAVEGGTQLRVTESGFDAVPLERRAKAFAANDQGWTAQLTLIAKYLASEA